MKIKNSGNVQLKFFRDPPDGDLFIAEAGINIPFEFKRAYFINNLSNPTAIRGKHAHKKTWQVIFAVSGSFLLTLDDGKVKRKIQLRNPSKGIIIAPQIWHTMTKFSADCNILVLANKLFSENDYIRDYEEFLVFVRKNGNKK